MTTVFFITHDGEQLNAEAPAGKSVMQAALDNGIPGILGDCGGCCSCATCHGYVEPEWLEKLDPRSQTEEFMLEAVPDRQHNSRLCCQIKLSDELDGIVVRLPAEQY